MAISYITEKEKCCGCGICESICPQDCITMRPDEEGFLRPVIKHKNCIECGACQKSCPTNSIPQTSHSNDESLVFACKNKDREILYKSSSGGFFYEIARQIISEEGIVFGAVIDSCKEVKHVGATSLEEVLPMMGSKYVQSNTAGIWPRVKAELQTGRLVLFSGTPCQVGALLSYLGKDYDNLVCIDFICMGVPSPLVFHRHIIDLENKFGSKAEHIDFRPKKYAALALALQIDFANGKKYFRAQYAEPFVKSFYSRVYLRPSCHCCAYKRAHRESDITMSDFRGLEQTGLLMTLRGGLSMIMLHSAKGREFFDRIKERFDYEQTTEAMAIKIQPMLTRSCTASPYREAFFLRFNESTQETFANIINKYEAISRKDILRSKLKEVDWIRHLIQRCKKLRR